MTRRLIANCTALYDFTFITTLLGFPIKMMDSNISYIINSWLMHSKKILINQEGLLAALELTKYLSCFYTVII